LAFFSFSKGARSSFNPEQEERIVAAIRAAELRTSGEIRVFIESRCRFVDPVDRAAELFYGLKMEKTEDRNGVILYVAMKDHQLAIFGDEGIHKIVGTEFWNKEVQKILQEFNAAHYVEGIIEIIHDIGEVLVKHFPYEQEDKNELPDNIVFGQ
jgi:uncharacterized membrane protein